MVERTFVVSLIALYILVAYTAHGTNSRSIAAENDKETDTMGFLSSYISHVFTERNEIANKIPYVHIVAKLFTAVRCCTSTTTG